MIGRPHVLDHRIDQIAINEQKTFWVRIALTWISSALLAFGLDVRTAAVWGAVLLAMEIGCHRLTAELRDNGPGTSFQRILYLFISLAISTNWIVLAVIWWMADREAFQIVAILCLTAQMMHAQAFMFHSPVLLIASAGLPAATLWFLVIFAGGFSGFELVCVLLTVNSAIGYVFVSAHLNFVGTQLIEKSRGDFQQLANTDPLTGLANRRMFTDDLRNWVVRSERERTSFALLLLDLDKFKAINDTAGHDAGDRVLVEAAKRLRDVVGERGQVARLGGDEFGIILSGPAATVTACCDRIVGAFSRPIEFAGLDLRTSPSVGVAFCPQDAADDEALLKTADLGLYEVKRGGGSGWMRLATRQGRHLTDPSVEKAA